jgi:hypothetical protein
MAEVTNESFQELIAETKKASGLSSRRVELAKELTEKIDAQTTAQADRGKILEAQGIDIKTNKKYQEEEMKIARLELNRARITGSSDAEDEAKKKIAGDKDRSFLKNIATGITGIAKGAAEKVKAGFKGIGKFLFGAMLVGVLAFLNSPKFEEIKNTIIDVIVPALAFLYDKIIKPLAFYIGGKLKDLFADLKDYVDGKKGIGEVLTENIGIIAGIVAALAPGLTFGLLKSSVLLIGKGLLWASAKSGLTAAIKAGFAAIKLGFIGMKASLASFLVPLLPIIAIAAGIVLVLYSLKKGFDDFMFELEATGSIWEATKTGIVSVISNILGLPFDLLKDGVSWIIGKIGSVFGLESFTDASKAMDDFSFVDTIGEFMTFMGDAISGVFDTIVGKIQNIIRSISIPGLFDGDNLANSLFGTKEEQAAAKKAKAEEQKQFEEKRIALREQQKLEKEAEEAKKREKIKAEQSALQPKEPTAPALTPMSAYGQPYSNIVNAPTSVVNANSSSNTSTSTPIRQPNMVIGMLANAN